MDPSPLAMLVCKQNMGTLRGLLLGFLALAGSGCGRADSRTVIRFIDQPDNGGGWKQIVAAFEAAYPAIRVELVEGPAATNARETMYATAFMAGDATYDVVYMDVIWVPKFASSGWLLPLDDRLPVEARGDFLPGDIRAGVFNGRLYRVPMRSDAGMLYYRKDLVDRPPETFDELVALARKHANPPDRWGFVFQGRQYEGLTCAFLEILWGHGGDVLDAEGRVVLDSPEAVRALTWLAGLIKTVSPESVITYQEEEARAAFQEGHAVFMRNWPYAWTKAQQEGSPVRGNVGIVPMVHAPGASSAATLGGWGFGIAASTRHPDAAWTFVRYASSAESMRILNRHNGAIPARRALFDDPEILKAHPHYGDLLKVLLSARPRPVHPRYAEMSDVIQTRVSSALVGKETPGEAVRAAAAAIRGILERK